MSKTLIRRSRCESTAHPIIRELRSSRQQNGITQRELAKTMGYALATIERAETGSTKIQTLPFVEDFANALGYRIRWELEKIDG